MASTLYCRKASTIINEMGGSSADMCIYICGGVTVPSTRVESVRSTASGGCCCSTEYPGIGIISYVALSAQHYILNGNCFNTLYTLIR